MKKLFMILGFAIMTMIVYAQSAPVANMRVATATTAFGINIPVGYLIYDYGADKLYVCKAATASTATLTTGSANFSEIALGAGHSAVTIVTSTAHGLHLIGQAITMDTATVSQTGTLRGTDFNTFNNKVTSITAGVGINIAGTTTVPVAKVDTADASILSRQRAVKEYAAIVHSHAQSAITAMQDTLNSFLRRKDTANVVLSRERAAKDYAAKVHTHAQSAITALSDTFSVRYSRKDTATVLLSRERAAKDYQAKGSYLAAGDTTHLHNVTDSIRTALKNTEPIGDILADYALANSVKTPFVETQIEVANNDSTAHYYVTPTHTPATNTIRVLINNAAVALTTGYTIVSNKIRIGFGLLMYDKIDIAYSY